MNPRIQRELDEILNSRSRQLPRETAWSRFRRRASRRLAELGPRLRTLGATTSDAAKLLLSSYALALVLYFWRQDILRLSRPLFTFLLLLMGALFFAGYFLHFSRARGGYSQPRWRGQVIYYRRRNPLEEWFWRLRHRR